MATTKKKKSKIKYLNPDEDLTKPANRAPHKFFNLQSIIEVTGIQTDKIYNNFKGIYNSLTDDEKKRIATCLMTPTSTIFESLGMRVTFSKIETNGKSH